MFLPLMADPHPLTESKAGVLKGLGNVLHFEMLYNSMADEIADHAVDFQPRENALIEIGGAAGTRAVDCC